MGNGLKSQYFAIMLYDEDPLHVHLIQYIMSCPLWLDFYVLICHDKDIVEPLRYSKSEAEPDVTLLPTLLKKRHYHVLLHLKQRTHLKSFLKMFSVREKQVLDYALVVDNPYAYVTYMLHSDFDSLHDDKKFKYSYEDLKYSLSAEKILDVQNGNFVQYFEDILNRLACGEDIFSICSSACQNLSPASAKEYITIVQRFQYLFVQRGGQFSVHRDHKE